jgi:bifunctional non-homologous end joining protein LigD
VASAAVPFLFITRTACQRHITANATEELKIDGFRSLAYVENGQCDLVSRNGNTFRNFKDLAQWIGENLHVENAVLDGEIACVDDSGRSIFNDLLFRRRGCVFFAFDLLYLNGEDLRGLPLVERKVRLRRLLRRKRLRILYVDHIEKHGRRLFEKVCGLDLGRHRRETEGLAVWGDRKAITILDQDQELVL